MLDKVMSSIVGESLIIVSPYRIREYENIKNIKQLIIEDIGIPEFRSPIYKGYESIMYVYKLASYFLRNIDFDEDRLTLLINGETGFDLGVSLKIIEILSRDPGRHTTTVIVQVPSASLSGNILSRFYAYYKILLLYDVYFNAIRKGSFRIIFLNPNIPQHVLSVIYRVYDMNKQVENTYSLLSIFLRIYKIPVMEAHGFLDLLLLKGEVEHKIKELKLIGSMLSRILDEAPPEVWEKARKYRKLFRKVKSSIQKLIAMNTKVEEKIRSYLSTVILRDDYTFHIVQVKDVVKLLLKGYSETDLVNELDINTINKEINKTIASTLTPTYELTNIYSWELRTFIIPGDLFKNLLEKLDLPSELKILTNIQGDFPSKYELIIMKNNLVPLCSKCPTKDYLPTKFKEMYESHIGLVIESHFPDKIIVGDRVLTPEEVYKMNPISYSGFEYISQNNIEIPEYKILSKLLQ